MSAPTEESPSSEMNTPPSTDGRVTKDIAADGEKSFWIIVGVIGGVAVLLIAIVAIIAVYCRKKKQETAGK